MLEIWGALYQQIYIKVDASDMYWRSQVMFTDIEVISGGDLYWGTFSRWIWKVWGLTGGDKCGEIWWILSLAFLFFWSNTEQPCVVAVLVLANPIFGFPLELPRNPSPIKAKFLAIAKSSRVYGWTPSVPHFTLSEPFWVQNHIYTQGNIIINQGNGKCQHEMGAQPTSVMFHCFFSLFAPLQTWIVPAALSVILWDFCTHQERKRTGQDRTELHPLGPEQQQQRLHFLDISRFDL